MRIQQIQQQQSCLEQLQKSSARLVTSWSVVQGKGDSQHFGLDLVIENDRSALQRDPLRNAHRGHGTLSRFLLCMVPSGRAE